MDLVDLLLGEETIMREGSLIEPRVMVIGLGSVLTTWVVMCNLHQILVVPLKNVVAAAPLWN